MADDNLNRKELLAWLETQPHEAPMAIASRAVLRVMPFLFPILQDDTKGKDIVLPLIYGMALPRAAAIYPARGKELAATAADAADAAAYAAAAATAANAAAAA
ncbi:MAG: hypothetical protein HWE23_17030, partial [Rhodobacteraceae bacterium]|nr:hypothetical protein [Paracoccaceae bacterium]